MKTLKTISSIVALILTPSYSKEEDKVSYAEENPLPGTLISQNAALNFYSDIWKLDTPFYQFGYTFSSKVKGTINSI